MSLNYVIKFKKNTKILPKVLNFIQHKWKATFSVKSQKIIYT